MLSSHDNTGPSQSPDNHQHSSKRRRVALACSNCRERKVRCDGATPICGSCRRKGLSAQTCEYLVIVETAKHQTERAYVKSLQEHIANLEGSSVWQPEAVAESHDGILRATMDPTETIEPSQEFPAAPTAHLSISASGSRLGLPLSEQGNTHKEDAETHVVTNIINAMGAAVADPDSPGTGNQFYGKSSIVSLMQQHSPNRTSKQPKRRGHQRGAESIPSPHSWTPSGSLSASSFLSDDFSLPPRKMADWLLEIYFNSVHVFYPWFHRESFLVSYGHLWSGQDDQSPSILPDIGIGGVDCSPTVLYCALNAMFALACEHSSMAPEEKRVSSQLFFSRMKSLVNVDILDSGSIAHVQALLLVGTYLQCTRDSKRCWNVVGMAYRMSVGLGLHLSRSMLDLTTLEREMRWRIWCACVQMDIIVSMTMGRPAMTSPSQDIPLPSSTDDRYLSMGSQGTAQPEGTISTNQFFLENMKLIRILGSILSNVYHSSEPGSQANPICDPWVDYQAVVDIETALENFEAGLHPTIHWCPSHDVNREESPTFKRLSNVLHARFLHLRLLLYRPGFSEYCTSMKISLDQGTDRARDTGSSKNTWSKLFLENCATRCIESACDLVGSLQKATIQDVTGAWWFGVFYLISAGIILILAEMNDIKLDTPDPQRRAAAWNQCSETLQRMVDVHPSARDYKIALNGLMQRHLSHETHVGNRSNRQTACTEDHASPREFELPDGLRGPVSSHDALSPLLTHWDSGLEDIMLPVQLLQGMDEELLLPTLF